MLEGIYTISSYTSQFSDAIRPGIQLELGETYRIPEDPNGTGCTADGREIGDFSKLMHKAGLIGEYTHTEGGWDHYELVLDPDAILE